MSGIHEDFCLNKDRIYLDIQLPKNIFKNPYFCYSAIDRHLYNVQCIIISFSIIVEHYMSGQSFHYNLKIKNNNIFFTRINTYNIVF